MAGSAARYGPISPGEGSVNIDLIRVIEEREELVKLFLLHRIVLVVVALRAAQSQSEPHRADSLARSTTCSTRNCSRLTPPSRFVSVLR